MAMLPNPGFRNFIDIVVVALETLLEEPPVLSVDLGGKQEVELDEITENVWVGSYTITGDGQAEIAVAGTDLAGNVGEGKSEPFTAQAVPAGAPANIQSADGLLALNIPAGALDRDVTVVMMAVPIDEELLQDLTLIPKD